MAKRRRPSRQRASGRSRGRELPWAWGALLAGAFVAVALALAWPSIRGEFLSDDHLYIVGNPWIQELSLANARVLLDPWGPAASQTLNYAPVHLFVHALEWHFFGEENLLGWRVVNAVAHGLTSALLVLFLMRGGVPRAAAVLGGAFFLVHPANLEVLAWIFQLKTILSLALALGALLVHPRRPALGAALFALALLAKITAVFALPVLAAQAWARARSGEEPPRWGWVAAWCGVFAAVAGPEMVAFQRQADPRLEIHPDPVVHARTIVGYGARYLWMSATGSGVSNFHEPEPAVSWLDPWWLAGLVAGVVLAWRTVVTLVRGEKEAAFWVLAAASFAPVSQIFPFVYPLADRYLYSILPGLIGGVLLAGAALLERLERSPLPGLPALGGRAREPLLRGVGVAAGVLVVVLAVRTHARSPVFASNLGMMQDAALHYPEGMQAQLLKGQEAARRGHDARAVAAFGRAVELGFADLAALLENPQLARLRARPDFQAVLLDLARRDVERLGPQEEPTQAELRQLALAYVVRDQRAEAIRSLERALAMPGNRNDQIRDELAGLRRRWGGAPGNGGDPAP